jgi:hypothetical protein
VFTFRMRYVNSITLRQGNYLLLVAEVSNEARLRPRGR